MGVNQAGDHGRTAEVVQPGARSREGPELGVAADGDDPVTEDRDGAGGGIAAVHRLNAGVDEELIGSEGSGGHGLILSDAVGARCPAA